MARLIPRKQIEEQQNITGSLTIGENLFLGNDALVSGSLFVSKSFFFGNDTGSRNEITGSVFLTGSLTIDGDLFVGAPDTVLSIKASGSLISDDTQRYAGILAKDLVLINLHYMFLQPMVMIPTMVEQFNIHFVQLREQLN